MRLVITLASRGRPQRLLDTVRRTCASLALPNTYYMVNLDGDDAGSIAIASELEAIDKRIAVSVREREDTIAGKWNRALSVPADAYLIDADDAPYVTPGFDRKILDAAQLFPDGIGMVYGHMANLSFSGVLAPTAKLCEKLGYIFPEYFPYWFVDHWVDDICRLIGRVSFADVRTDQSNVGATQEMREPGWWATWYDAGYLLRHWIAKEIVRSPDFLLDEGLKRAMLTRPPPVAGARIDNWSRAVNSEVRNMRSATGLALQEPRYVRVRKRAVEMIPSLLQGMDDREATMYRNYLIPPVAVTGLKRAYA